MTSLYNDVMTIKEAGATGTTALDAKWNGRVRVVMGTYEAAAAPQGDTVAVATIPAGAYVLPSSTVYHDALGSNSALAIGTTASPALFAASEATTSAGDIPMTVIGNINTAMTAETDILLTVSGTGAITGTIESVIHYAFI